MENEGKVEDSKVEKVKSSMERTVQIKAPEEFSFRSEDWEAWRKRFLRYLLLSGLEHQDDSVKIDLFLYTLGKNAEQLAKQLKVDEINDFGKVVQEFEAYFKPKRNVIYDRFKFNTRVQLEQESVVDFVKDLHSLSEPCQYGELKEEFIRDRIVVGLKDRKTSERLQLMSDLKLEDAVRLARQAEEQKEESKLLWKEELELNRVGTKPWNNDKSRKKCGRCARFHLEGQCPAVKLQCLKCGKTGHYARCCRDWKKVNQVETGEEFKVNIEVGLGNISLNEQFLIDTGADIVALPPSILKDNKSKKIYECEEIIRGPDGTALKVLGAIYVELKYKTCMYKGKAYIIKNLKIPILGKPAIRQMQILKLCCMENGEKQEVEREDKKQSCVQVDVEKEFPQVFDDLGVFKDSFTIKLIDNPVPFVQTTPRGVSIPLLPKVKEELNTLVERGVLVPVEEPTMYVSPIVVVPKGEKGVRICGDYTHVNKNVLRPIFPISKVENTLAKLKEATVFSKIDATSGFYQIKLDPESRKLTTILTPFGRYMYNRLPMGLNCAPEYFAMKFSNLFSDLEGIVVHIDDILVYTKDQQSHNRLLREVLNRLTKEGLTINKEKCVFNVSEVGYLGHIINAKGISLDPQRVNSIVKFEQPQSKKDLMRFLGLVNYVGRFIKDKTNILEPLNELLKDGILFVWGLHQEVAFKKIKEMILKAPTLSHYDPNKQIIVSADSSSYGLGAVLLQENQDGSRSVVSYASRTLNSSERNYAQIEKEALALVWALHKFKDFVIGIEVILETDHKPLLQILQTKPLDDLTPRLLRFRLQIMRYSYKIVYVPGKKLVVADALSRAPLKETEPETLNFSIGSIKSEFNQDYKLNKVREEQNKCKICSLLKIYTLNSWPNKNKIPKEMLLYYQYRFNFSVQDGFLLYSNRLVIPAALQKETLYEIHEGHLGVTKCRERAKQSVWWLGLSTQIKNIVENCPKCIQERINSKEPLQVEELPKRAWQQVGIDLFMHNSKWYVLIIDYYSRYLDIFQLHDLSENTIIKHCKETFSRFGVPEVVRTDCGTQFKSKFVEFSKKYNFRHITSSPYYAQSNGCAEAGVKVAKNLLKKNEDVQLALLVYRNTPLECGYSPSELLFNRKIREILPMFPDKLNEIANFHNNFQRKRQQFREKMATNYNKRHKTIDLSDLNVGDMVWVINLRKYGMIVREAKEPRSYFVEVEGVNYRRNRWHLIPAPFLQSRRNQIIVSHGGLREVEDCTKEKSSSQSKLIINENCSREDYLERNDGNSVEVVGENEDVAEIVTDQVIEGGETFVNGDRGVRQGSSRVRRKPNWMDDYIMG